jgi:hypothetical protein
MQFHQKDGSSGVGHMNLNPRCNIANWGTLPTVEIFKIISSLERGNYAWGRPPYSSSIFSQGCDIFHFHSRPQTKDKPFRTKLGRGNYTGNYPPIGVVEGYRGCGSLCSKCKDVDSPRLMILSSIRWILFEVWTRRKFGSCS